MVSLLNPLAPGLRASMVAASLSLAACSAFGPSLENPEVSLMNVVPLESTIFEQRVETELRIRNPNDVDLNITGLDVEIGLNGRRLVRVLSSDTVKVPRFGEATIKAIASTSTVTLLRQVAGLQREGVEDPSYEISGYVYLGSGFRRRVKLENSGKLLPESAGSDSGKPQAR